MKSLKLKISLLSIFTLAITSTYCFAQQGTVTLNQDSKISKLLDVKKEMNKYDTDSERYKIQIYSGNSRGSAESAQREFNNSFSDLKSIVLYEPPNFKTWIGNFRTRLEADRALKNVKGQFPNAFIFKPKN